MIGVRYVRTGEYVQSMMKNYIWSGVMMKADCPIEFRKHFYSEIVGHDAPYEECTCGFYAYYRISAMDGISMLFLPGGNTTVILVGAYGRVIEHERGFRAEYMQPLYVVWPIEIEELSMRMVPIETKKTEKEFQVVMQGVLEHYRYVPVDLHTAQRTARMLSVPIIDVERAKEMLGEQ